jgi:hypothetical protein
MEGILQLIFMFALFCLIGSLSGAVPAVLVPYFFCGSLIVMFVTAGRISK